jgi:PAS domain S-box-containing protein
MSEPLFEPISATVNQSLMELRAILENATVGILFTRNRRIVQANPRAAEMWGYRHAEMIGLPGVDLFPSEADYDSLGERIIPLLQAGRSYKGQLQMKRHDGSLFWCSMSARAINPVRPMEATIWIMEDITEERLVQEALERSTAELSGILDAAYIGIILVRDRRIVRCNRSYEKQMGFPPGELIGKPVNILTPDPPRPTKWPTSGCRPWSSRESSIASRNCSAAMAAGSGHGFRAVR